MNEYLDRGIAVVGVGAIMPDAPDAAAFWDNIKNGRYSISEVDPVRWDPELYYDPDPKAPNKSYSKIGGWVREWDWDPRAWKLALMPRVAEAMDDTQKWAVACTHQALADYGYPSRPLDPERVAVILGNAMGGERHYQTVLRVNFTEIAEQLGETSSFHGLPLDVQRTLLSEFGDIIAKRYPDITEDSMPGELSNCIAGRVANLFGFRGPNYVIDAACASAMAATSSAVHGLVRGDYDAAITGGIDRNMGVSTFVKFCKIGALSATGTRPYADGADGFVMGEGGAVFLLKRLRDAYDAGDHIYAVILGVAGSSDGKGKGITAPNPVGQKLAVQRAWANAGVSPQTASLVEGHGTSTKVGDVVEHESMAAVFSGSGVETGSIALGSVKSNIGHLKAGAGAAGLFKVVKALDDKVLPPSLNFVQPNPDIDFAHSPFRVNTELREWGLPEAGVRRAGASAFGFGGTNFHTVLEEYSEKAMGGARVFAVPELKETPTAVSAPTGAPTRRAALVGAATEAELAESLASLAADAAEGRVRVPDPPPPEVLAAAERVAIDFASAEELADKAARAQQALSQGPAAWKLLRSRGVFRGSGPAPKVAFLYTGQGSQYPNMLRGLVATNPIAGEVFDEADRIMAPLLDGTCLRDYVFADPDDPAAMTKAEEDLRRTEITQPAVLSVDQALTRLLAEEGVRPDFVMGHSLGEYGALVAAGALPFEDALEAVSARGQEMSRIDVADPGLMAAVFAPLGEIEQTVDAVDGNVVVANINSPSQAVIGGASAAVEQAEDTLRAAGRTVARLPVSMAFHTSIVAPASEPLKQCLTRLRLGPPSIPLVANVSGDFYPMGPDAVPEMIDILGRQVASPVQFLRGLHTLYDQGARVFVEVGPKKALHGFVEDAFADRPDVSALFTNHPKWGDAISFNQARCGLYAAGIGRPAAPDVAAVTDAVPAPESRAQVSQSGAGVELASAPRLGGVIPPDRYSELGRMVAEFVDRTAAADDPARGRSQRPIVVTGAALGLPGTEHMFDPSNLGRLLNGEQMIKAIPADIRDAILDQHITRLVKGDDGSGRFETIDDAADVIKLAARAQAFDPVGEFGIDPGRFAALDSTTCMAIAAGFDALHDAGIPLVQHYKTTHIGTRLPERWGLPDELRDDTAIIFASAFPGMDAFAGYARDYYTAKARSEQLAALQAVRASVVSADGNGAPGAWAELDRRISALQAEIEAHPYVFDRRFLFRTLSMGHSQFAEIIGARGPNTQLNAACASTTQSFAVAEDWIRAGRCRRVVVVAADNVTSDNLLPWIGAGFLASGAAATDEAVEEAATPFDRRRHGMIIGMGAAAVVLEDATAAEERAIRPIAEVLSTISANSAFHGTRLDVNHITDVMERLLSEAEQRWDVDRKEMAPRTVFISHETYTPARGGSAAAEVASLRSAFGSAADQIVIANTKAFTGHPMGVGIEDVVAIKSLETGLVPPIPNFKEVDPDLGELNLSQGGSYPVSYALRLAAGFGSQISLTLLRWVPTPDGNRRSPDQLGYEYRIADTARWKDWLAKVAGTTDSELEVVQHQFRVVEGRPAVVPLAPPPEAAELVADVPVTAMATTASPAPAPPAAPATPPAPAPAATPEPATAGSTAPATSPEAGPAVALSPDGPAALTEDEVRERVLAVVADKTGYPPDMLDLELDLEADLGIDTVKQAELFATVREAYAIPRDDQLKLRDFPTLDHVIHFVLDRAPQAAGPAPAPATLTTPPAAPAPAAGPESATAAGPEPATAEATAPAVSPPAAPSADGPAALAEDEVRQRVLAMVADKTGYPPDMLDLELDLEADLGIDTVKQAELFATVREAYAIPRDDQLKLRDFPTLDHVIHFVLDRAPQAAGPAPAPATLTTPPAAPAPAAGPESATAAGPEPATAEATAPAVSPPAAPSADGPAALAEDEVRQRVLAMVADKTGYPPDMLDLELDLEADLGIDTVKQAELFATVREAYAIPRDDQLKLRDFPTLDHVIGFVLERAPKAPAGPQPADANLTTAKTAPRPRPEEFAGLEACETVPRRVPVPMLRPPLELCRQTPVILASGTRVVVMPDHGGVCEAVVRSLRDLGAEPLVLDDPSDSNHVVDQLETWKTEGPVSGVYWLPALDTEATLHDLDFAGWKEGLRIRVKLLAATMRALYDHVSGPGTFLVSATRMGGRHGYDAAGATAPMGGAVAGFTKAYKRERPDCLVKVVDVEPGTEAAQIAAMLVEETRLDPGAVEIGRQGDRRWSIGLEETAVADGGTGLGLDPESVFVVTGAAGSIVSAIVSDLATVSGGTFHLLDLVAEPDPANPDLDRFVTDRDGLKRDLFQRIKDRGERATPALVEKELAQLERARAALDAMASVRRAGGQVVYHQVDLRVPAAVGSAIDVVRRRNGQVDVLVHGAGLEVSRSLADKPDQEYDLVFDVKSDGWFNLLSAIGDMPLAATVCFSSVAGRFGNGGQTDYSAANDLLCKITSSFRNTRPGTRGLVIDWTAWADIGMATRGSIPKMMELAGIDMLNPAAGIPWIRRELVAGTGRGEVVVGQRLGDLTEEVDPDDGLDRTALVALTTGPMIGNVVTMGVWRPLTVKTVLDPSAQGFLDDHRIDGTAVLPGAMGVEAFAELALMACPGSQVSAVEEVTFQAPFKFYRNQPREITLEATLFPGDGDDVVASCRLLGTRMLANQTEPQVTTHFTGRVRVVPAARRQAAQVSGTMPVAANGTAVGRDAIYGVYFHGPTYQVLERSWHQGEAQVGLLAENLPPNHHPGNRPLASAPRLLELCFQTAGVWELGTSGRLALPQHVALVAVPGSEQEVSGRAYAVVTPRAGGESFDAEVVDDAGRVHLRLTGYRTIALPVPVEPGLLRSLQIAVG